MWHLQWNEIKQQPQQTTTTKLLKNIIKETQLPQELNALNPNATQHDDCCGWLLDVCFYLLLLMTTSLMLLLLLYFFSIMIIILQSYYIENLFCYCFSVNIFSNVFCNKTDRPIDRQPSSCFYLLGGTAFQATKCKIYKKNRVGKKKSRHLVQQLYKHTI